MKRPFPGMDPYLEHPGIWPDFHDRFLKDIGDALAGDVSDDYDVRIHQEVRLVAPEPHEPDSIIPDVAVRRDAPTGTRLGVAATPSAVLEAPAIVPMAELDWLEDHHLWLEVRRWPGDDLVTVIEVLSPWNKTGEGFLDFARKRRATLRRGVHWVELDLLAGGTRTPLAKPRPPGDCFALIARTERRPDAEIHAWGLRGPLPTIPVPLRAPDPDVTLDLEAVFAYTFDRGRYERPLRRFSGPPPGPFAAEDLAWAEARHAERG